MSPNPTVAAYLSKIPKEARAHARAMRAIIRASAPQVRESIKWGMPAYSYNRIIVMFGVFKHHIGLYPTPSAIKAHTRELKGYTIGRGSIQFPLSKPLPRSLIKSIIIYRIRQSIKEDTKWKS